MRRFLLKVYLRVLLLWFILKVVRGYIVHLVFEQQIGDDLFDIFAYRKYVFLQNCLPRKESYIFIYFISIYSCLMPRIKLQIFSSSWSQKLVAYHSLMLHLDLWAFHTNVISNIWFFMPPDRIQIVRIPHSLSQAPAKVFFCVYR